MKSASASLSKDAAVLRGVLEKQAGAGAAILAALSRAGELGTGALMRVGATGIRGAGKGMESLGKNVRKLSPALKGVGGTIEGAGAKTNQFGRIARVMGRAIERGNNPKRQSKGIGQVLARFLNTPNTNSARRAAGLSMVPLLGGSMLGAGAYGANKLLGGGGAPAPAQASAGITPEQMMKPKKAPKNEASPEESKKEAAVKNASLSKQAVALREVLEKQAFVGGLGRLLLSGGGRALRGIGGFMGSHGLGQAGTMVGGAGDKLKRLGHLAGLGAKYGLKPGAAGGYYPGVMTSKQLLNNKPLRKLGPAAKKQIKSMIPDMARSQGIAQLTGLGATGLGGLGAAGLALGGGGGGAEAQGFGDFTPDQMMMIQQMLQQGQGQGMNTSASPKNDGIQKAAVARELGRITARTVLVKQAVDRDFKVRTAAFTLLAKKAGYRSDEINAVVKSAALQKQALWGRTLLTAGALGGMAGKSYIDDFAKKQGWWGKSTADPVQKRMKEFGELMQKGKAFGLSDEQIKKVVGNDPRFKDMFAKPNAGVAGVGAAGAGAGAGAAVANKNDPRFGAWVSKLYSRAGIDPNQEADTSDALLAMSHGADIRQQRGRALQNIARMNYSYGV